MPSDSALFTDSRHLVDVDQVHQGFGASMYAPPHRTSTANRPRLREIERRLNSEITEVTGDGKVEGLKLKDTATSEEKTLDVTGFFVAIGREPRS